MAEVAYAEFKDEQVRKFLRGMDKRLKEIKGGKREYARLLSSLVFADVIGHFDKQESEEGAWPKWSKSYAKFMEKIGKGGNRLLQDTGSLRQGLMPIQSGRNYRSVNAGLLWFNPKKTKGGFPYAYAHDTGGPKLPQRQFMWLSSKAMDKISEQTLQYMTEKGL